MAKSSRSIFAGTPAEPIAAVPPPPAPPAPDDALRRDEARYRTLVRALTQVVWTAGPSGQFVDAQPSWSEYTGQTTEEALGWGWLDAVHADDRARIRQTWRRAVGARAVFHAEFRLIRHDGTPRWVSARAAPVLGEGAGAPVLEYIGTIADVDELRRATDERARLLEGERRSRSEAERLSEQLVDTLESISEAFFAYDHDWRIVRMNSAGRRALARDGVDPEAALGRALWDVYPGLEHTPMGRQLLQAAAERTPSQFEERTSDGAHWLEVHVYPTREGVAAWTLDVTERHRVADATRTLAEASRVLASSLDYEATLDAVARLTVPTLADYCIVDLIGEDGRPRRVATVHADPALQPLLDEVRRYPPLLQSDNFVARVLRSGVAEVAPDADRTLDPDVSSAGRSELARLVRALHPCAYICVPMATPQGTIGSILCVSTEPARRYGVEDLPLFEELARRAAVAVEHARLHAAERSARVAAERANARLRAVQELSDAAASEASLDDMLRTLAERVCDALQADAAAVLLLDDDSDELVVRASLGLEHEAAEPEHVRIGESFAGRVAAARAPMVVRDADDIQVRPMLRRAGLRSLAGAPLLASGRLIGVVHVGTHDRREFSDDDVRFLQLVADRVAVAIERARILENEQHARAEAERANRAKMDFLAMMSHELRTPLNAIAGYAELLELGLRGPVTEAQLTDLRAIRRNEQHLLSLIEEVLSYAKLDAGRVHVDLGDIRIPAAIESSVSIVASQIERKGLRLGTSFAPGELVAHADLEKLQQILVNLLSNATKFTPQNGTIVVSAEAVGDRVIIRVKDNGVGIPPDQHERIFEPFVQLESGLARRSSGTGLGLSISRELARAMRGDLTVSSAPGEGAEFTLTLPRRPRSELPDPPHP